MKGVTIYYISKYGHGHWDLQLDNIFHHISNDKLFLIVRIMMGMEIHGENALKGTTDMGVVWNATPMGQLRPGYKTELPLRLMKLEIIPSDRLA